MVPPDDTPPGKCLGKLQQKFLRACVLAVFIWLVFYGVTLTDMKLKASNGQLAESWNVTYLVQNAFSQLPTTILMPKTEKQRKLVLLWTSYFSSTGDWLPSTKDLQCPVSDCYASSDRSLLSKSSAVLFHWRNLDLQDLPTCVPSENVQCPLWLLFNEEAPPHTSRDSLEQIQNKIHWTVTYRRDSDVYAPYGKVVPRRSDTYTKIDFDPNRRLICWLVSNCNTPSQRELFVQELKKHVQVNVYGQCGDASCPHRLAKDCYQWLSKTCKFYLSFENSNCRDYTTEKLYYALSSGMVPVVLGSKENYAHLPSRSFISAADFSSPKELAEYLVTVGNDKDTFLSYLSWRKHYEVVDSDYSWFCDLCAKLHGAEARTAKPGKDLASWWYDETPCVHNQLLS